MRRVVLNRLDRVLLLIVILLTITVVSTLSADRAYGQNINRTEEFITIEGVVLDSAKERPLHAATVVISNSSIGTISNRDGVFRLNIPKTESGERLSISYMGYQTLYFPIESIGSTPLTVKLTPVNRELKEVLVFNGKVEEILYHINKNIERNYSSEDRGMRAFYRESIAKGKRYVSLSEAVIDIDKADYSNGRRDKMWLAKGRKHISQGSRDTLIFKLQGGPGNVIYLDHAKYRYLLLDSDVLKNYLFKYSGTTQIDGRSNYIIEFKQRPSIDEALTYGTIYVDSKSYAISKMEFDVNLENRESATKIFIKKRPIGAKAYPVKAHYIINYTKIGDKWSYSYGRAEVSFKIKWKRRLFNSFYNGVIELAITDFDNPISEEYLKSDRLKSSIIISDEIEPFKDSDFWGSENTIEPDKSIENAIDKLVRKEARR